ncbi:hypothetical protein [Fundicoccus culcitae]|uniref:Antitoxin n=1 Tax=Fundicoccus culcitae TaxID=2969821 RepID=A0ABY5P846_9LACT|nr:hypothetical protein [Fundicoccus culcitae]UUX34917.1 hypothetical protein NRE15_04530 [Fundicoccus culcitae]
MEILDGRRTIDDSIEDTLDEAAETSDSCYTLDEVVTRVKARINETE